MTLATSEHVGYMQQALALASEAMAQGHRPVGCVIVRDGAVIATGINTMASDHDPSAHAEVAAIRTACATLQTIDLSGSTLYSTLECCPMCFWCMQEAKVSRLVLGGRYAGIGRTDIGDYTVESFLRFTGRTLEVVTGVLQAECEAVRLAWLQRQNMP